MFQYPPPEEDYIVVNGKRIVTKWQVCISCHEQVFTTQTENVVCGECRAIDEANRGGGILTKIFKSNRKEKISDGIRWEVFGRDNFTCCHCGSRKNLTVDHIYPESKGGKATLDNCQTLCKSCNSRKGAR
jgi:hypothetical protein